MPIQERFELWNLWIRWAISQRGTKAADQRWGRRNPSEAALSECRTKGLVAHDKGKHRSAGRLESCRECIILKLLPWKVQGTCPPPLGKLNLWWDLECSEPLAGDWSVRQFSPWRHSMLFLLETIFILCGFSFSYTQCFCQNYHLWLCRMPSILSLYSI